MPTTTPAERGLRLREALAPVHGDGLRSLIAYGNGLDDPRASLHLLVVLDDASARTLARTAGPVSVLARSGIEPLFVATGELPRSLDCYPLEFLLMQAHYELLAGGDCLAGLRFERGPVRLHLEEALRSAQHWLRQEASRRGQVARNVLPLVANSFSGLDRVWLGLLWLLGEEVPAGATSRQLAASRRLDLDAEVVMRLHLMAIGSVVPSGDAAYALLEDYDTLLTRLIDCLDGLPD